MRTGTARPGRVAPTTLRYHYTDSTVKINCLYRKKPDFFAGSGNQFEKAEIRGENGSRVRESLKILRAGYCPTGEILLQYKEKGGSAVETGTVFNIQKFSVHDGPGLRTTVFFKGCNLRCPWCHNPESWRPEPQLLFFREKCTGCGLCREVCGRESCTLCGGCAQVCTAGARAVCGREYTVRQVMDQVLADKAFYDKSGGGVTFSGGECMLQPEFLAELLRACRSAGISTAVDTAGCVPFERFERILPDTDLFLYDIKCVSPALHKAYTRVDNSRILENYRRLLAEKARVWVRVPVIPGFNDDPREMEKIRAFLAENPSEKVELLAYHDLGAAKGPAAGREETWEGRAPTQEQMQALRAYFAEVGL